jgi:hypothetical protein
MKHAVSLLAASAAALALAANGLASQPSVVARASQSVVLVLAGNAQGSAFAFGKPGHYLTNAHVVEGVNRVKLVSPRGQHFQAVVVSRAEHTDVAELRAPVALRPLKAARQAPRAGDRVLAIGSASGLAGTVTEGIVSATGRWVGGVEMIQTDAAVNPGSSGGVLLDESGRVLGITTSLERQTQGIAFAIPIARAERAVATRVAQRAARATPSTGGGLGLGLWWLIGIGAFAVLLLAGMALLVKRQLIDPRRKRRAPEVVVRPRQAPPPERPQEPVVIVRRRPKQAVQEPVAAYDGTEPSSSETED